MANDYDIFGKPGPSRDEDIFKDLPASKPEVKGKETPSRLEMLKKELLDSGKALLTGGALGMHLHQAGKGAELMDRVAYSAGEKATDLATSAGASPETAAKVGYGANLTTQVAPMLLGGEAAKLLSPTLQSVARSMMQSAIKPTIADLKTGDAAKAIDTLLSEGITPTKAGLERMRGMVDRLGDQVSAAIANSTETVSKGEVGKRLLETYNKFKSQVNPQSDLEAIKKAWGEFRNHPDIIGQQDIPVQVAQRMKQGTYTALGSKPYGELQGAATEAQKALARGLKEEISTKVPQVAPLNKRQSELLNAIEVAERRALMEGNKNTLGMAPLAPNSMSMLTFLADRSALINALAAQGLFRNSAALPANAARLGLGELMLQRGQLEPGSVDLGALYPY